jgi:hypothetical protein
LIDALADREFRYEILETGTGMIVGLLFMSGSFVRVGGLGEFGQLAVECPVACHGVVTPEAGSL